VEFNISFTQVSQLTGYQLCAIGAFGVIMSTFTRLYGKRPVFIVSVFLCLAGTIWCGVAKSFGSLVGARVLQGTGISVWESIMYSSIGDLYFVHQRGSRMAFFGVCASGFGNLGPLIAGVVAEHKGWRWCFYILNIFIGVATIGIVFFGWEITYERHNPQCETHTLAMMNVSFSPFLIAFNMTLTHFRPTIVKPKTFIRRQ
jgi:MFS family permease